MFCTTKFTIILPGRLPSQRESVQHCKFSSEIWRSPSQNWFSHIVHAVETMLLMASFWTKLSSYASVCTVIDHKSLDGCSSPWRYIDPWGGCSRSRTCETRIWAGQCSTWWPLSEYRRHPLLKMTRSKSSVIPFLVPRRKVWLTLTARAPCSNAANIG